MREVDVVVGQQHGEHGLAVDRQRRARSGGGRGGGRVGRQAQREARAAHAGRAPAHEAAAVQRRQLQRERDAQAQCGDIDVLERRRRFGGRVQVGRRRDRQGQRRARQGRHDADRAAALGVARDVVDEVAQRLRDALGVAA